MRAAKAIAIYAAAVLVLGTLLAPWLFWLVQWLAANFEPFAGWTRHPFRRIFNRSLMIVALAGLWPLLRSLGYRSWSEVGYRRTTGWWRHVLAGFAVGLVSLGAAVALARLQPHWNATTPALVAKLLATGLVVALIEETFFRGGLQGSLQRGFHWLVALLIASAIYSALHYLKPTGVKVLPEEVTWLSGLDCLGQIVSRSFARSDVLTGLVTLFLAGSVLGFSFAKTGTLYFPIGLHAGWVVANELVRELRGGTIVEDWRTWPVLLALLGALTWAYRKKP